MSFLNAVAALIGWMVFALWLMGALGMGDFALRFGPAAAKQRPVVCARQSMGHPEQCDKGSGCRWIQKLEHLKTPNV